MMMMMMMMIMKNTYEHLWTFMMLDDTWCWYWYWWSSTSPTCIPQSTPHVLRFFPAQAGTSPLPSDPVGDPRAFHGRWGCIFSQSNWYSFRTSQIFGTIFVQIGNKWHSILGGGSNIFYFHPYVGKWSNLTNMFQMGWNHHLVYLKPCHRSCCLIFVCVFFVWSVVFLASGPWACMVSWL